MRDRTPEVMMDEDTRLRALAPIERMLQFSAAEPGTLADPLAGIAIPFGD